MGDDKDEAKERHSLPWVGNKGAQRFEKVDWLHVSRARQDLAWVGSCLIGKR